MRAFQLAQMSTRDPASAPSEQVVVVGSSSGGGGGGGGAGGNASGDGNSAGDGDSGGGSGGGGDDAAELTDLQSQLQAKEKLVLRLKAEGKVYEDFKHVVEEMHAVRTQIKLLRG